MGCRLQKKKGRGTGHRGMSKDGDCLSNQEIMAAFIVVATNETHCDRRISVVESRRCFRYIGIAVTAMRQSRTLISDSGVTTSGGIVSPRPYTASQVASHQEMILPRVSTNHSGHWVQKNSFEKTKGTRTIITSIYHCHCRELHP